MQVTSISFKAKFINNTKYQSACEGAYLRYQDHLIKQGEELLAKPDYPNHILKLMKDGIKNITTKKIHKFPWLYAKHLCPVENLLSFYQRLKNKDDEFIKRLFK